MDDDYGDYLHERRVDKRLDQIHDLEVENRVLEGAVEYWQDTALAHRRLLREILADSPHQHVKTEISTHLKKYEGDTDEL